MAGSIQGFVGQNGAEADETAGSATGHVAVGGPALPLACGNSNAAGLGVLSLPDWVHLHAHGEVDSTSDLARLLAMEGAPGGTVVVARSQARGRGRLGRSWSSPEGNLYASVVLREAGLPRRAAELGFVAALAVADAIDALGPDQPARLKWPNDVLLGGAKVAGLLVEAQSDFVVLGAGINLLHRPQQAANPATTLALHASHATPAAALVHLCQALDERLAQWRAAGLGPVLAAWRARGPAVGEAVGVTLAGRRQSGSFLGLNEDGALLVRLDGVAVRVTAGDVSAAG